MERKFAFQLVQFKSREIIHIMCVPSATGVNVFNFNLRRNVHFLARYSNRNSDSFESDFNQTRDKLDNIPVVVVGWSVSLSVDRKPHAKY